MSCYGTPVMSLLIAGEFMVMEGHTSATERAAYLVSTPLWNFGVVAGMYGLCGAAWTVFSKLHSFRFLDDIPCEGALLERRLLGAYFAIYSLVV